MAGTIFGVRLDAEVVRLTGEVDKFLRGLSTNEPESPLNAFLDRQGRIVSTFELIKISELESHCVIPSVSIKRLRTHLNNYLDLGGVQWTPLGDRVYFDIASKHQAADGERVILMPAGRLVLSVDAYDCVSGETEFRQFRHRAFIPLQGEDYDQEMILNLGDVNRVSFTKGCFLGQEVVARVHYRGRPPKYLSVQTAKDEAEANQLGLTSRVNSNGTQITGFAFQKSNAV